MSVQRWLTPLSVAATATLAACMPSVSLPVLQPALVAIPAEIQTVAVIDRSGAKSGGEQVLGVLEGIVTGEAILGDKEGREKAIQGVVYVLQESPRFEVIAPQVNAEWVEASVWDKPLSFKKVKNLCKKHGCDGVISLESFDSDSNINTGLLENHSEGEQYYAERRTTVTTSWRFYDATANRILDAERSRSAGNTWRQNADTSANASAQLPTQAQTIRDLGYQAGTGYAARVAPTWQNVSRSYYAKGSPDLKIGKRHVRVQDWDGAVKVWHNLATNSTSPKVRGRALYNLALASEVSGDLDQANEYAKQAGIVLGNSASRSYAAVLRQRLDDQIRLEAQLAPPEPIPGWDGGDDGEDEEESDAPATGGKGAAPPATGGGKGATPPASTGGKDPSKAADKPVGPQK